MMAKNTMKTCSICHEEYPATTEYFYKDRTALRNWCKRCERARVKQYRDKNPEAVKATWHRWYVKNKERHTENNRRWESENPDRVRELKNRYNKTPNGQENRRKQSHLCRVRKYETTFEEFSSIEIFERDGWRCSICGKKVNRRFKWPNQMSASLDHIIPLSKGGTHTRDNVCCAHLQCNQLKNNSTVDQQMLLIG